MEDPIDPYTQSEVAPPLPLGQIDVGRAVTDGLIAAGRNALPLTGMFLLLGLAYGLSICTCVGWIPLLPVMAWVAYRAALRAVDGQPIFGPALLHPEFLTMFLKMWGVFGMLLLLLVPVLVVSMVTGLLPGLGMLSTTAANAISTGVGILWGFFFIRFAFAPLLVVDASVGVLDAFGRSFTVTGPQWGRLVLLQLLFTLLSAPMQVMIFGSQLVLEEAGDDPEAMLEAFNGAMAMIGVGSLVAMVSGVLTICVTAAAHRQLFGRGVPAL